MTYKRFNVNFNLEEKEEATEILKPRGVSFSWLIRHLLREWLKEQKTETREVPIFDFARDKDIN